MEFKNVIDARYSCRKYKHKDVELDLIKKCIKTAGLAPSACNSQPWKFHVVYSENLKQKLVKLTQPFTQNASFIVVEEEKSNLQEKIVNKLKNQEFHQVDIGIACSYLCLQATELGLATCMIGYFNENKIKELLHIPSKKRIRLIICIGYEDENNQKYLQRKNLNEIMKIV